MRSVPFPPWHPCCLCSAFFSRLLICILIICACLWLEWRKLLGFQTFCANLKFNSKCMVESANATPYPMFTIAIPWQDEEEEEEEKKRKKTKRKKRKRYHWLLCPKLEDRVPVEFLYVKKLTSLKSLHFTWERKTRTEFVHACRTSTSQLWLQSWFRFLRSLYGSTRCWSTNSLPGLWFTQVLAFLARTSNEF